MSMSKGRKLFICSKPLQFLVCCAIVRHYNIHSCDIFVITRAIKDFERFLSAISISPYSSLFEGIYHVGMHSDVIDKVDVSSYDEVFFEDDRVSFINIISRIISIKPSITISVFEEGFGTYLSDYPFTFGLLKKIKWGIHSLVWGSTLHFGQSRHTSSVYVQYPDVYASLNHGYGSRTKYSGSLLEVIEEGIDFWRDVLDKDLNLEKITGKKTALVMGTWGGMKKDLNEIHMLEKYEHIIYKPHPHDGLIGRDLGHDATVISQPWYPSEALIMLLCEHAASVSVFHYSSSCAFYLEARCCAEFKDLMSDHRFVAVTNARTMM